MRFIPTYKIYKNKKNTLSNFPLRILKFKKSKWKKKILSFNLNSKNNKIKFVNFLRIINSFKKWNKIRSVFKLGLSIKTSICSLFENSINIKFFKRNLLLKNKLFFKNIFLYNLIYPIYRLDSFLSKLKFFTTSFQARQAINNSIVLINNKSVSSNYFLKKKDIISFKTDTFFDFFVFRSIFKAFSHSQQFFSFCEFCPYTKTIVIIKSLDNLSDFDFLLLNFNSFDYKKFLTYISK